MEIYSHCGPSSSKETKSLKTLPMEELETILLAWFRHACTAKASTDEPQLKEKALHAGMGRFWTSDNWTDRFNKINNLV
jgi:hypothetical protein